MVVLLIITRLTSSLPDDVVISILYSSLQLNITRSKTHPKAAIFGIMDVEPFRMDSSVLQLFTNCGARRLSISTSLYSYRRILEQKLKYTLTALEKPWLLWD